MEEKWQRALQKARDKKGFTLIEMMIVLFIITALLLIIIPNAVKVLDTAQDKADSATVKTYETEQALYRLDHNGENPSDADLSGGGYLSQEQIDAYHRAKGNGNG